MPFPPTIHLLKQSKKRSLTTRTLTPVHQVRTFDEWAECYFQDYHIKYNQEEKKWESTDGDQIKYQAETFPSGKLVAEYYEKYYEDYDGWCLQRERIANGTVEPISVPVGIKNNHSSSKPRLELGLGLGLGYLFIHPLPPRFVEGGEGASSEVESSSSKGHSVESSASPSGFIGEIDQRGAFHQPFINGVNEGKVRFCYNKDEEIIGIDADDDLILRTPYADRFSRSDSLSPGAAKRPHWELGADGKAHIKVRTSSGDKKPVGVANTTSDLPRFWKNVARGKAKLPPQLRSTKISPKLFVEYRVPSFVSSRNGSKKIFVPGEGAKISSREIPGKYEFLQWAVKQEKIVGSGAISQRFVLSPTSPVSTTLSPRTPLTPVGKRRQQQRQQQQRQQLITVAAPVPVPVPVPAPNSDLSGNTHLNGDTVKIFLGEYIGSLNRAGPPELPEGDLELIYCQALLAISNSLPPDQNSSITYEKLLSWYQPIANSVAQFKTYRSLTSLEQEAKHKKLEKKVAKWQKRLENKNSDDES